MHPLRQSIWGHIWKPTAEKSPTNATNATLHPLRQTIWRDNWKPTVEKSQTNATSVTLHPYRQVIWGGIWKHILEKSPTNATNEITQPSCIEFQAGNLGRPKVTIHPLKQNFGSAKIGLMQIYKLTVHQHTCVCHLVHPQSFVDVDLLLFRSQWDQTAKIVPKSPDFAMALTY